MTPRSGDIIYISQNINMKKACDRKLCGHLKICVDLIYDMAFSIKLNAFNVKQNCHQYEFFQ